MSATLTEALCERCGAPFEPVLFPLPVGKGETIMVPTRFCPHCAGEIAREEAATARAARDVRLGLKRPLENMMPTAGAMVTTECRLCRQEFDTESIVFQGDKTTGPIHSHPTICDACAAKEKADKPATVFVSAESRRRKMWVGMTGIRYSEFQASELPAVIRPFVEQVLAWKYQPKGIGLVGPSRTGKSPLLYALGQSLFVAGHDVFPTSGIDFQRKFHRAIEHRQEWASYLKDCENCEILLIDDADKVNLTAGLQAEYYGMLETRRNWQRPVLCTLNLTGVEIAALGRDRSDVAAAIVERLRDLTEFISIQ